jgi:hypothetical protein
MKQLENSMEIQTVYLKMFYVRSISYSANVNAIFEFFPRTLQLWLTDIDYGLWNFLLKIPKGLWYHRLVYLVFHISP